jgi:hypothetical protein
MQSRFHSPRAILTVVHPLYSIPIARSIIEYLTHTHTESSAAAAAHARAAGLPHLYQLAEYTRLRAGRMSAVAR